MSGGPHPPGLPLRVEELGPGLEPTWDALVRSAPGASPFHLLSWRRTVESSFGHRPLYLVARRGCHLAGILPLFHMKSLLFGHSLVSVPFAVRGGVVADDVEAAAALLAAARGHAEARRVDYLELRSESSVGSGLVRPDLYLTYRADLREDEGAHLRRMDRKRRQMLAHAGRAGYEARVAGPEGLPLFYRLFCRNMRHHGTPVYPRRFLAELVRQLGDGVGFFFAYHRGEPVAGVLSLLFEGLLMPFYAGRGDQRLRGVEEFLYWQLMRWGRERGFHTFDFGRSRRGSGAAAFKARWGMEEVPLAYGYELVRARRLPNVTPANPRYRHLITAWRRLPLPLTRLLGPAIASRIP